ncbi:SDR family NAD(P)-dependent oxidoreductase [uncultured Sphingomonas sp.]|uniref:SDR family NAD(P)-dependent oxidoreductase n=1 Tax=uncultured Sphingomonas sp. TaxID=158754 RepID=UPI00258394A5|nr:SDR family NAD(P)-dependent oxidoreductase [uncultured Sphingomonas sp.]
MSEYGIDGLRGRKVIVTGGAGFIGSHLCEGLVEVGADVICMDDLSAGKTTNVRHLEGRNNFHFVEMDVCDDSAAMDRVFEGVDTVFHNAASKKNICLINPHRDLEVNAGGALNLLKMTMKHGVRKFVQASTGSVYGEPQIFPTTESHPFEPVSYYGVSKLAGERYVDVFHRLYGLDTTILRYFHVYGPRQESNEFGGVVSIFLRRITQGENPVVFGHGEQVRSFTWVRDLVEANLRVATNPVATGKAYNAASGIRVTINELARGMLDILDKDGALSIEHGEPLIGDIMEFDVANGAIREDLGLTFEADFWGTLRTALGDVDSFLGRTQPATAS